MVPHGVQQHRPGRRLAARARAIPPPAPTLPPRRSRVSPAPTAFAAGRRALPPRTFALAGPGRCHPCRRPGCCHRLPGGHSHQVAATAAWISCSGRHPGRRAGGPRRLRRRPGSRESGEARDSCLRAVRRILPSSSWGWRPRAVFTTRSMSPLIRPSTTCGRPSWTFRTGFTSRPWFRKRGGAGGGGELEAEGGEAAGHREERRLVLVVHREERRAVKGQLVAGSEPGLGERLAEIARSSHHLAGGLHLRPKHRIHAREAGGRGRPAP